MYIMGSKVDIFYIDRLMKVLNRKILAQSRFPEPVKDLEASYIHSGFFKDIYEYINGKDGLKEYLLLF